MSNTESPIGLMTGYPITEADIGNLAKAASSGAKHVDPEAVLQESAALVAALR